MRAAHVAVIGAGPAGMAAAYALTKHGAQVHVYEAAPHVGGLTRSFSLWNEIVDFGPHIFAGYSPRALALWQEVIGTDYRWLERDTRISIRDRVYRYPLQPSELLAGLGVDGVGRAILSVCAAQLWPAGSVGSSERLFVSRFGRYLYELFFRPYCEKLWGIDPGEVDVAFYNALVGDISIFGTCLNKLRGELSRREATLQPRFPYARDGAGAFCERAMQYLCAHGGHVKVGTPVTQLLRNEYRVTGVATAEHSDHYDWVVSSMPLPLLLRALGGVPEQLASSLGRLRFRSTILVYLRVRGRGVLPHLWMYANDRVRAGRITNFATWQGNHANLEQTLALEYYCTEHDTLWTADDDSLGRLATQELATVVPDRPHEVVAVHVRRVRNTHPLYYRGCQTDLAAVSQHVQRFDGLTVLGRAGRYEYDSQASALERGIEVADMIMTRLATAQWMQTAAA